MSSTGSAQEGNVPRLMPSSVLSLSYPLSYPYHILCLIPILSFVVSLSYHLSYPYPILCLIPILSSVVSLQAAREA